ncbi:metallophosphoesterase [Pelosinus sp. sgz500959]|uniref:metallophosphoesterase n=1 Tax=Pelosinus sp. sgz500959 TaxID=3242472 RepID=UPI00366E9EBE
MNSNLVLMITIFLAIYSTANYYVGWRGWQGLNLSTAPVRGLCYKIVVCLLAAAYPLARLGESYLPSMWIDNLTFLGALWVGTLYYLCLFTLLIDLLRFINRRKIFLPEKLTKHPFIITTTIFCTTLLLISYGTWNARHPLTQNYEITIPKPAGSLETLQVVMVSDIHLGNIITNKRLTKLINRINQLEPDLVLFTGDIIDSNVDVLQNQNMIDNFARLKPKFGTYGILGNHEYFDKKTDLAIQYLEQGHVHMLRDQSTRVADAFYLVGRDDLSKKRYTGIEREELSTVMTGTDHALPIILLDHQPHNLQDGIEQGVDLQLSGHTHLGQLFPNNLLTKKIYELDWGYLRKEGMQIIVSCGVGTWGPPIRIGNHPEIVNITIHFQKPEHQSY